jgi:hypothetical protein
VRVARFGCLCFGFCLFAGLPLFVAWACVFRAEAPSPLSLPLSGFRALKNFPNASNLFSNYLLNSKFLGHKLTLAGGVGAIEMMVIVRV